MGAGVQHAPGGKLIRRAVATSSSSSRRRHTARAPRHKKNRTLVFLQLPVEKGLRGNVLQLAAFLDGTMRRGEGEEVS